MKKGSNLSLGRGEKGSKFWMQMIPDTLLKQEFDRLLDDRLLWLSPLAEENYREYELREEPVRKALGIPENGGEFDFWPRRQPQWDGIAVSEDTGTLYLVEAKAHLKELESSCTAGEHSRKVIIDTMLDVHDRYYSGGNFSKWLEGYYQLGNRLTFLHKMKEMKLEKYPDVKLILLNIVRDYTYRPTDLEDWKTHYSDVFQIMTGSERPPSDVLIIYYDVKDGFYGPDIK